MVDCETCEYFKLDDDTYPCCNCKGTVNVMTLEYMRRPNLYKSMYIFDDDKDCRIRDSGNRREFESGAVRDIQEGKGRCDLLPLSSVAEVYLHAGDLVIPKILNNIERYQKTGSNVYLSNVITEFIREYRNGDYHSLFIDVSIHFEEGAKKYGVDNWKKGIPTNCYIDSALRHFFKYLRGDTDEPHGRAFVWNLLACIWTCDNKPELNVYKEVANNE